MFSMKIHKIAFAAVILFSACTHPQGPDMSVTYPKTATGDVKDNYFGTIVPDPYRWLENDTAANVKDWVQQENAVTQGYLSKIPYRDAIHKRLTELWNYARYSAPFKKGGKYYFSKNDGLQNQSVMYVQDDLNGAPREFFNPNTLSADGTVALTGESFSKDGKKVAYIIQRSGSDWQEVYVKDAETGKKLSDSLRWVKFSGAAWQGDGFYYSRFDEPKAGNELVQQNKFQKVYYHKIGDAQSADKLVYEDKAHADWGFGADLTRDERFVIISASEGASSGNHLYYKDNQKPDSKFTKLFDGFKYTYSILDNVGDQFLMMTNEDAPKNKLVIFDPMKPEKANWETIIPEKGETMVSVNYLAGKLIVTYMKDASHHVYQYDLNGKLEHEITLPGPGSVGGFGGEREDTVTFYSYTSFTYPPTIFKYNVLTGVSTIFRKSDVKFNPDDYVTEQVFYPSKDGTKIPMFMVHKKGMKMDGNNPTYLYAYGGFNISLNPSFSATQIVFLENGGIYAMPNLRGGGEYGEEWHKAGMLEKKQNVFDDFIAAAEYLIKEKYTSTPKLAICGRSNGGLLIGACETQRPDLYKVCLPGVGVMDMLRFHKFTIGYAWTSEYGSSDSEPQFKYLIKYSPIQNLKKGVSYPATLITTADHDDRVVPAHSFKYAATIQADNAGPNPVLIRIDSKAGHGGGKPTTKLIDEWADIWSFVFYNLGMEGPK